MLGLLQIFCIGISFIAGVASWPLLARNVVPESTPGLKIRSTNTCADPSLTETVIQAYVVNGMAHILDFRWAYIATNAMGTDWQLQAQSFSAWDAPQTFTVPLFRLVSTGPTLDFMYAAGTGSVTPPTAPEGWVVDGSPLAWVYATQTCGSIPLMGVANAAATDHWYTTDVKERNNLVDVGWVDAGVVAFVLPV